jgi:hypothetical protein
MENFIYQIKNYFSTISTLLSNQEPENTKSTNDLIKRHVCGAIYNLRKIGFEFYLIAKAIQNNSLYHKVCQDSIMNINEDLEEIGSIIDPFLVECHKNKDLQIFDTELKKKLDDLLNTPMSPKCRNIEQELEQIDSTLRPYTIEHFNNKDFIAFDTGLNKLLDELIDQYNLAFTRILKTKALDSFKQALEVKKIYSEVFKNSNINDKDLKQSDELKIESRSLIQIYLQIYQTFASMADQLASLDLSRNFKFVDKKNQEYSRLLTAGSQERSSSNEIYQMNLADLVELVNSELKNEMYKKEIQDEYYISEKINHSDLAQKSEQVKDSLLLISTKYFSDC